MCCVWGGSPGVGRDPPLATHPGTRNRQTTDRQQTDRQQTDRQQTDRGMLPAPPPLHTRRNAISRSGTPLTLIIFDFPTFLIL